MTSAPPDGRPEPEARREEDAAPGPGFICLRDPGEMRMVLFWQIEVLGDWSEVFKAWDVRPLNLRTRNRNGKRTCAHRGERAAYFHPEVAQRLIGAGADEDGSPLGADPRRSHRMGEVLDYPTTDAPLLRIGALEVLRVDDGAGPCAAVLVVHAVVPDPRYGSLRAEIGDPIRLRALGDALTRLLAAPDVCGEGRVALARFRSGKRDWYSPPLFTLTWVPRAVSAAWIPLPGESAADLSGRIGLPVSSETLEELRRATGGVGRGSGRLPLPVLAASGWQWGRFPSPTGLELGRDRCAAAAGNTHVLSQNWAVAVWEHGAAYLPRQDDVFLREGMLMMCSTDLDVYLLVILSRLRVRILSRRLADTAQEMRSARPGADEPRDRVVKRLDDLINRAIELDGEAIAFLASEWWTDVSSHEQADLILSWMQDVGGLDRAVAQAVEQARLLRESVQTLIERQEHLLDQDRQDSARMMEWAIGVLTFVGMPLSVLLEVWVNWDSTAPTLWRRGAIWWLCGLGVLAGAVLVGWLLARAFGVSLSPPRWVVPEKREKSASEKQKEQKPDDEKSS